MASWYVLATCFVVVFVAATRFLNGGDVWEEDMRLAGYYEMRI
jgi:hypothetical protein